MGKSKKSIGKPPKLLYRFALFLFEKVFFPIKKIDIEYDVNDMKELKGPAIVLASHTAAIDPAFVALACKPRRLTFIVSEHFITKPLLRFALTKIGHVITKKMFCPDASTIFNILRAKKEGNIIAIFPEGRLNSAPHSHPVTQGTPELCKKLGVDVFVVTANGASMVYPKWAKTLRKGKVEISAKKLFSADEIKTLDISEITAAIDKALLHDDEIATEGQKFIAKEPAKGLDGILYKCPECEKEFSLISSDDTISCSECGFKARFNEYARFENCRFKSINEWYRWQIDALDINSEFSFNAQIGSVNDKGNLIMDAGSAQITLDKEKLSFVGTVFGEEKEFSYKTSDIGGTPYTPKREFDIYHDKKLIYILPENRTSVSKYASFVDKVVAQTKTED